MKHTALKNGKIKRTNVTPSDLKKFLLQHFQHLELGDSSSRNAEIACTKLLLLNLDGIVLLVTPRRHYTTVLFCVASFHN